MKPTVWLILVIISLVQNYWAHALPNASSIQRVHVVFSNHLDVGFDGIDPILGFSRNVINKYFTEYIPLAIETANDMRKNGSAFIWTTHSWVLSLYLDCPPEMKLVCPGPNQSKMVQQAIRDGDITWHAFPFNSEMEVYDASLASYGFEMTHAMDDQFKLPRKLVMSQRDVPGTTRSLLPILNRNGIKALSVGVNGATAIPIVPQRAFVWSDPATNASVLMTVHGGGYGGIELSDTVMVDGWDTALVMDWKGDNAGPHTTSEAISDLQHIQSIFPNADVFASTFDAFFTELETIKDKLPVMTSEIGDTWIYGIASDPLKLAATRAAMRARTACQQQTPPHFTSCDSTSYQFHNFSRLLLKNGEHTWGGDVKKFLNVTSLPDYYAWSNTAFAAKVNDSSYQSYIASWFEQRDWGLTYALEALPPTHPVRTQYEQEIKDMQPTLPNTVGYEEVDVHGSLQFEVNNLQLAFNEQGAVSLLKQMRDTTQQAPLLWADDQNVLGLFVYETFDEADFNLFLDSYMNCDVHTDCPWAYMDFGKVNVTNASPQSASWYPELSRLFYRSSSTNTSASFILYLSLSPVIRTTYGSPSQVYVTLDIDSNSTFSYSVSWLDKPPTRLPEAAWFVFQPLVNNNNNNNNKQFSSNEQATQGWQLSKLGGIVAARDVVVNGSSHLHAVDQGFVFIESYTDSDSESSSSSSDSVSVSRVRVTSVDSALMSVGTVNGRWSPFPSPLSVSSPELADDGIAYNLFNNIWGTNYVMWYPFQKADEGSKFRFTFSFN